jgi:hypothetical protein
VEREECLLTANEALPYGRRNPAFQHKHRPAECNAGLDDEPEPYGMHGNNKEYTSRNS